jgi:hypothetical protein
VTWAALQATGRGRIVVLLEVTGYPRVLATESVTVSDSWYTDAGYGGVDPWLE